MSETRIRVFVVDDHPVVRHGLLAMLQYEADMQIVGSAADGGLAVTQILAEQPDVVLLDLRLPTLSGVEVMRTVRAQQRGIRFLVLTTYDTDEYIAPALAAGAQGYLLKDSPPEELLGAVRRLMQGQVALEPTVAARLMARMSDENGADELSPRELEVIRLLVSGASNKEIAAHLVLSENTIKTHLSRIFDKLGARSRAEVVAIALQRNLLPPNG